MNILVTNNHVIYNSHNPDIDHKKEPAKNPGDSDFFTDSVLYFLMISASVYTFIMPCVGLLPFLPGNN